MTVEATSATDRDRARGVGALVGAVVAVIPGLWGMTDRSLELLLGVGLIGAPVAAFLGWQLAVPGRDGRSLSDVAFTTGKLAVLAAVLPAVAIGGFLTLAGIAMGPAAILILPFAVLFSVVALAVTIPCAVAWTLIVRMLPGEVMRDGGPPIHRVSRRIVGVGMIAAMASVGAVPHGVAALDGRRCVTVGTWASELTWAPDGLRVFAVVESTTDPYETRLLVADVDAGTTTDLTVARAWIPSIALDADGQIWWIQDGGPGQSLWVADPAPRLVTALDGGWSDLHRFGDTIGIVRWKDTTITPVLLRIAIDPTDRVTFEPMPSPWGTQAPDSILTSGDGSTVAWSAVEGSSTVRVARDGHLRNVSIEPDGVIRSLSYDGRSVVYDLYDGTTRIADLDGRILTTDTGTTDAWSHAVLRGNDLAAVRSGFRAGHLCVADISDP